jgi:chemotaxis-related protein WspD
MDEPAASDCWKRIGTYGDESCPALEEMLHCRACKVFLNEGRRLLDREAPDDYVDEWTAVLAEEKREAPGETVSALVFRLHGEWFALRTSVFQEMVSSRPIHTIPHRSGKILLGLVNVRGELLLCASLSNLLEVEVCAAEGNCEVERADVIFSRMAVIARRSERWAFPVDEVEGIRRLELERLEKSPVTVSRSGTHYSRALLALEDKRVALLDEELVFNGLQRSLR